jgi:hypothetical protein
LYQASDPDPVATDPIRIHHKKTPKNGSWIRTGSKSEKILDPRIRSGSKCIKKWDPRIRSGSKKKRSKILVATFLDRVQKNTWKNRCFLVYKTNLWKIGSNYEINVYAESRLHPHSLRCLKNFFEICPELKDNQ